MNLVLVILDYPWEVILEPLSPCPHCGLPNDPVHELCAACLRCLPDPIPILNSLTTEELFEGASIYVVLADAKGFGTTWGPRKPGGNELHPNYWERSELIAHAETYLARLADRPLSDSAQQKYMSLHTQLKTIRRRPDTGFWIRVVSALAAILIFSLLFYLRAHGI